MKNVDQSRARPLGKGFQAPAGSITDPDLAARLRGFKRVAIPAGQTVTVTFTLSPAQSATYDGGGNWQVEAGRLDFMVGPSSDRTSDMVSIEVTEAAMTRVPATAIETEVSVQ